MSLSIHALTPDTNAPPKKARRHWRRWVVALIVGGFIVGRFWLIPAWIESRLQTWVNLFWQGHLSIDRIEFRFLAPTRLRDLRLVDTQGRTWIHAKAILLRPRDLLAGLPITVDVSFDDLSVWFHPDSSPGDLVSEPPDNQTYPSAAITLGTVIIENGAVGIVLATTSPTQTLAWQDISVFVVPNNGMIDLMIHRTNPRADQTLELTGHYNPPSSQIDLSLSVHHVLTSVETEAIAPFFVQSKLPLRQGILDLDLASQGRLDSPHSLWPHGSIVLNDGKVRQGTLSAGIILTGPDANSPGPTGQGDCFLDDANLSGIPDRKSVV